MPWSVRKKHEKTENIFKVDVSSLSKRWNEEQFTQKLVVKWILFRAYHLLLPF